MLSQHLSGCSPAYAGVDYISVCGYVSDLLQCTNEPNVSIPQLANLLIERVQHLNWVVVFKGLISIHHLMNYGNEVSTPPLRPAR